MIQESRIGSDRNNTVKNMTVGNPARLIMEFAIPVFLSQVFQQLYNTADALIVGRFLGTQALAAVSSSGNLIFLFTSFFVGTSMGAGVVISKYFGAKKERELAAAIKTTVWLGAVFGLILTILGVLGSPVLLRWMDTDPEVMPQAVEYFRYYFLGILAMIEYNNCKDVLSALGDSKRPLYYLIFSSLLNIVLDVLCIGVFRWGVWSAAVATNISQAASLLLCLSHLKKMKITKLSARPLIDLRILKEIIGIGFPAGIQNSVISIANVVVQTNINSFGTLAMAAYGSYTKIEGFAFLPVTSFTMALTTYTSQNLGAREYDRAKKGSRFGICASVLLAELIGVAIFLGAPLLMRLFTDHPEVIAIGVRQARIEALFFCLLAFSHAVAAVCRGAGKAFVPMIVMLLIWCVVRILYITAVMRIRHELVYIYWAYPLTWSISSVIYLIYYLFSDWIHGFEK